jgi:hypothetical protein
MLLTKDGAEVGEKTEDEEELEGPAEETDRAVLVGMGAEMGMDSGL